MAKLPSPTLICHLVTIASRLFIGEQSSAWVGFFSLGMLPDPAFLVHLASASQGKRFRRHIFRHRGSGSNVRSPAHPDGRHQHRSAAYENSILNDGGMLFLTVVIAGHCAGSHID